MRRGRRDTSAYTRTTQRRVFFYRVEHFEQFAQLANCLSTIGALPFDEQGRYQVDATENIVLSLYPDHIEYPIRLRFGKTRRDNLPQIERKGSLEPLRLDESSGLIDFCHIIIFSDGHVVAEYNHDGPRIRKLGEYLYFKGKCLPAAPRFLALYQADVLQAVNNLDTVRLIELDVPPNTEALIRRADNNLADAIRAAKEAGSNKRISVELVAKKGSVKLKELARGLASLIQQSEYNREEFNRLSASGYNRASRITQPINLLDNYLVTTEEFIRVDGKSRAVDTEAAYATLERSYLENQGRILNAPVRIF